MDSGYVNEIRATDVLFGRGSGANDHEGNIRFRYLVAERKEEYLATNHRNTKAKIAREIVDQVLGVNGRFLKRLERDDLIKLNLPLDFEAWIEADEQTIMEKAKQALRQNTSKKAGTEGQNSSVPHESSPVRREKMPPPPAIREQSILSISTADLEAFPIEGAAAYRTVSGSSAPFAHNLSPMAQQAMGNILEQASHVWNNMPTQDSVPIHAVPASIPVVSQPINNGTMPRRDEGGLGETSLSKPVENVQRLNSMDMTDIFSNRTRKPKEVLDMSVDMADLMDSFDSKTKIQPDSSMKKMSYSSETMGTIEGLGPGSNMSYNDGFISSDFSFRTNDSSLRGNDSLTRAKLNESQRYGQSVPNISLPGLHASLPSSDLKFNRPGQTSNLAKTMEHNGLLPEEEPALGFDIGSNSLGDSSISMLKGMLMSKEGFDDLHEQKEQRG